MIEGDPVGRVWCGACGCWRLMLAADEEGTARVFAQHFTSIRLFDLDGRPMGFEECRQSRAVVQPWHRTQ